MFGITAQLSTTWRVSLLLPAFPTPCTSSRMCFSTCPTGLELSREDLEPWERAKWQGGDVSGSVQHGTRTTHSLVGTSVLTTGNWFFFFQPQPQPTLNHKKCVWNISYRLQWDNHRHRCFLTDGAVFLWLHCTEVRRPPRLCAAAATCFWRLTIRSSGNDGSWLLASPMERVMGTLPSNSAHLSVRDVSQSLERGEEKQRVWTTKITAGFYGSSGSH